MIRVPMTASALANSRFAVSRMSEAFDGLRALADPAGATHLRSWLRWARPRIQRLDLSLLYVLIRTGGYIPDFLVPPPPPTEGTLEDDLAAIRATPADRVRAELEMAYPRGALPARLHAALADGEAAFLVQVADALRAYWDAVMEPWWPTIQAVLDADIGYRARVLARHGAAEALTRMDRSLRWHDGCLEISRAEDIEADWIDGGVVFSPSLFGGPHVYMSLEPWLQPVIYYPVRNVANGRVLRPGDRPAGDAALVGRSRAVLLSHLDTPQSTTALAKRLDLAPSTVSHHLGILYRAGLLERVRVGREIRYRRV